VVALGAVLLPLAAALAVVAKRPAAANAAPRSAFTPGDEEHQSAGEQREAGDDRHGVDKLAPEPVEAVAGGVAQDLNRVTAAESGVPYIGSIPMDPAVRKGGDKGVPVTISDPDSPVSQALNAVAMDVAAKVSVAAVQNNDFIPITMVG